MALEFKHPSVLWIIWHGNLDPGKPEKPGDPCAALAHALHGMFAGEWRTADTTPGAEAPTLFGGLPPAEIDLPVFFWCWGGKGPRPDVRAALAAQPAARQLVLLIIDTGMLEAREVWIDLVRDIRGTEQERATRDLVPLEMIEGGISAFRETRQVNGIPFSGQTDWSTSADLYLKLLVRLTQGENHGALPEVLLSYARLDGAPDTTKLKACIEQGGPLRAWMDDRQLTAGAELREEIEEKLHTSFYVAVVTEQFVRRRWTRWEAATARRLNRPMLVVDALRHSIRRLPPELANAPMVRWPPPKGTDRAKHLQALIVTELLRHRFHEQNVAQLGEALGETLVSTLLPPGPPDETPSVGTQIRLYADPPLTPEELALQETARAVHFLTLAQYVAERGWRDGVGDAQSNAACQALGKVRVGLSISAAQDGGVLGLHTPQYDDLSVRLTRALVHLGAVLAYGGDLRPGGVTDHLVRVVQQYAPEQELQDTLWAYIAWPVWETWGIKDLNMRLVQSEPKRIGPPDDLPPEIPKKPSLGDLLNTRPGRLAVARALAKHRRQMTEDCKARVAIGGPVSGYIGRMPGIIEEVWLALKARQPVYLLAGFGGATQAIWEAIRDPVASQRLSQPKVSVDQADVWLALAPSAHDPRWSEDRFTWEEVIADLCSLGIDGLSELNGLSEKDNRALAKTTVPSEAIYYVAKGLGAKFGR